MQARWDFPIINLDERSMQKHVNPMDENFKFIRLILLTLTMLCCTPVSVVQSPLLLPAGLSLSRGVRSQKLTGFGNISSQLFTADI